MPKFGKKSLENLKIGILNVIFQKKAKTTKFNNT